MHEIAVSPKSNVGILMPLIKPIIKRIISVSVFM